MKRLLFLLAAANFYAFADSSYFEVENVEVKRQSKNSLIAKEEAARQAARSAFGKLIEKETQSLQKLSFSDREIQDCVYDYSIDQEKISNTVYVGRFSYRFSKNKVATLLRSRGANVDFGEKQSGKVKLAVYRKDFLRNADDLEKLKIAVEEFSNERVVFEIAKKRIPNFRKLRIKYAPA
ncbi:MAG: hypothetical protein LBL99_01315 [Holosporaceae bacterium]|jgi:hypothetical protein|nr:hypothetical protein [Holosporaceae bacterium]